jgi:hypothetical protein
MGNLDKSIIVKRLALIKYLYRIGIEQSRQAGMFAGFSILTFHDSAEMFLLLVLEDKGDPRPQKERNKNIQFMQYWEYFDGLTLRESMNMLKERRRNIKHKGIFPSTSDIEESRVTITRFFKENTPKLFNEDFDTISVSDLIVYPNIREYVNLAKSFLTQNNYYDCLVNAKIGFEELLSTYESDKRQWHDSILSVGEKVGKDYRNLVSSNKEGLRWFEQVTHTTNNVRNILKVSALGIDYRKYVLFDFVTPKVIETCRTGKDKYVYDAKENFEKRRTITNQDCQFCIDFVIDSALKLQEFNFDINRYLVR